VGANSSLDTATSAASTKYDLDGWWQKELAQLPKKTRKIKAVTMMYCAWNLWKERNWSVFDRKMKTPIEVMQEIKLEVGTRRLAR